VDLIHICHWMNKMYKKVLIAGHNGMVGSAIHRKLSQQKHIQGITLGRENVDLVRQSEVEAFFELHQPDDVIIAAAKVGGIYANNVHPADFIYQNLMIQSNLIHTAYLSRVSRLLFLGSSCIYPREAVQPMKETALLTGVLEKTNEPYAIAKIAGLKMCESYNRQYGTDYRAVMPTNLYGKNDNYHPRDSHVVAALIKKFHEAKLSSAPFVEVWGSGNVKREFLHVDDMAEACIFVMNLEREVYRSATDDMLSHINVGTGIDVTIAELARLIAKVVEYTGEIIYDTMKPDGTPRKLLDVSILSKLGWRANTSLIEGLKITYKDYVAAFGPATK
jgi:GDP-L-fucose synthase